jgi:hypothetical protein
MNSDNARKLINEVAKDMLADAQLEAAEPNLSQEDKEDIEVTVDDANDLKQLASLFLTHSIKECYKEAGHLDTAVRELIPDNVWEWMEDYA